MSVRPFRAHTILQSMIDRQIVSFFLHTPEVLPELQAGAMASATRRYRNWRRAVERVVRSGGVNGEAAAQLGLESGADP